jgi:hypothetical protein
MQVVIRDGGIEPRWKQVRLVRRIRSNQVEGDSTEVKGDETEFGSGSV